MSESKREIPTGFQRSVCWTALSFLAVAVIIVLACAVGYGLWSAFIALEPVLLPVVVAGILAYLLFPCVVWVQRALVGLFKARGRRPWALWLRKRVSARAAAVALVMAVTAAGLLGLGFAIVPPLAEQTGKLFNQRQEILTSAAQAGRELLENGSVQRAVDMLYRKTVNDARAGDLPEEELAEYTGADSYEQKVVAIVNFNSSFLTEKAWEWLTAGTRAIYGASAFVIGAVMIPVFLFYFLYRSEAIANNWHTILPLRASRFRKEVVETLQQINDNIISFVRGQMLVSLIDSVMLGVALKILGLPYAISIAAAAAIIGIIPYIGMISTCIPSLLIAWFAWHDLAHVGWVLAIFVSVSLLDNWVIQPRVVGNRVGMHDLTVMFSVLFWGLVLGGIVGALLAVPLTASIKVLFVRYVWPTLGNKAARLAKSGEENADDPPAQETPDPLPSAEGNEAPKTPDTAN